MTSSALLPWRMMTMPETASPVPSRSAAPRRISGPSTTSPTSLMRMGVPFSLARTISSRSCGDLHVAAPADHVFRAAKFEQACAGFTVPAAHRIRNT